MILHAAATEMVEEDNAPNSMSIFEKLKCFGINKYALQLFRIWLSNDQVSMTLTFNQYFLYMYVITNKTCNKSDK